MQYCGFGMIYFCSESDLSCFSGIQIPLHKLAKWKTTVPIRDSPVTFLGRKLFDGEFPKSFGGRQDPHDTDSEISHYLYTTELAACTLALASSLKYALKLYTITVIWTPGPSSSLKIKKIKTNKKHVRNSSTGKIYRWMRSSRVVRSSDRSDSQCRSRNCPGFAPSIFRQSWFWGAAEETVLNKVRKKL